MPDIEHFHFDLQKFKAAVHVIIDYVERKFGGDALGNTKLHKCLYYSDVLTFLDTMHPLTGAEYQRQKFGPTARHLTKALVDLEKEGKVRISSVNYYGYSKKEYASLVAPNKAGLSNSDIATIHHVVEFVCSKSAAEISEFSHDEVWASVPMGSAIPYFATFAMFPVEFTPDDLDDAESEALRLAPILEAHKREGRFF